MTSYYPSSLKGLDLHQHGARSNLQGWRRSPDDGPIPRRRLKSRRPAYNFGGRYRMSEILRRLHDDHVNLLRVLAILERQIAVMDRGDRPDWAIVHGVIEYLLTYPDLHHHPLEDGILKRLQATNPSTAEAFSGLLAEHREQSDAL